MPSEYMTEGTLSDIFDFIKLVGSGAKTGKKNFNARKYGTVGSNGSALNMSSIARAAQSLTMSFPVLCSDTVSPDTAQLITKAVERNVVSMLQMLIGSYHISANSGAEAVKMIHTNLDNSFKPEDLIDATLGAIDSYNGVRYESFDFNTDCKRPPINYARILENCRQDFMNTCNIRYPESNFSESAISDYIVSTTYNNTTVLKEVNSFNFGNYNNYKADFDKDYAKDIERRMKEMSDQEKEQFKQYQAKIDTISKQKKSELDDFKAFQDWKNRKEDVAYRKQRDAIADEKDLIRSRRELFTRQLIDSDVKKANEVQPTLMVFPFYYNDGSETGEKYQEFVAGVKSRLIPCPSGEIIDQISRFNKQGVNLTNLIKATTKETSLAKEFIGGIEQAKIDAKRDSKLAKTSPIWRTLQSRSSKSRVQVLARFKNSKNAAAAITTLVITMQEAEYIAENYHIDITNPAIAREFMENYNLLCLIIVDEQVEIAKFIYDGEKYFTDYSFTALDKENNSNDTRKLISLLNKTR